MSKKIVFMGTASFSLKVLQMLLENKYDVVGVVTQPDRYVGRKKVLTRSTTFRMCECPCVFITTLSWWGTSASRYY